MGGDKIKPIIHGEIHKPIVESLYPINGNFKPIVGIPTLAIGKRVILLKYKLIVIN